MSVRACPIVFSCHVLHVSKGPWPGALRTRRTKAHTCAHAHSPAYLQSAQRPPRRSRRASCCPAGSTPRADPPAAGGRRASTGDRSSRPRTRGSRLSAGTLACQRPSWGGPRRGAFFSHANKAGTRAPKGTQATIRGMGGTCPYPTRTAAGVPRSPLGHSGANCSRRSWGSTKLLSWSSSSVSLWWQFMATKHYGMAVPFSAERKHSACSGAAQREPACLGREGRMQSESVLRELLKLLQRAATSTECHHIRACLVLPLTAGLSVSSPLSRCSVLTHRPQGQTKQALAATTSTLVHSTSTTCGYTFVKPAGGYDHQTVSGDSNWPHLSPPPQITGWPPEHTTQTAACSDLLGLTSSLSLPFR